VFGTLETYMEMEKKLDDEKKEKCSAENLNDFKKLQ
jgi:hypothetical protein